MCQKHLLLIKDDAYSLIVEYSEKLGIEPREFVISAFRNQFEMAEKIIADKESESRYCQYVPISKGGVK